MTLAVGKPSARPRAAPRTTRPSTSTGRESSVAASRTSPSAQSSRTRVDEQGTPSTVTGGITATPRPSSAPSAASRATFPARPRPKLKS